MATNPFSWATPKRNLQNQMAQDRNRMGMAMQPAAAAPAAGSFSQQTRQPAASGQQNRMGMAQTGTTPSLFADAGDALAGTPGAGNNQWRPPAPTAQNFQMPNVPGFQPLQETQSVFPGGDLWNQITPALNFDSWGDKELREKQSAYLSQVTPALQMILNQGQNAYTNQLNANEQGWAREMDRFQMGNTNFQNQMNLHSMLTGIDQWNNQFGLDQELGRGRLGLDQQALGLEGELGRGRLDLDRTLGMNQQALDRELGLGRLNLDQQGLGLERELGMGQLNLDRDLGFGRLGLDQQQFGLEQELGRGRLGLDQQQFGLEQELGRGRLNLDQQNFGLQQELGRGELDLNRLTQQQRNQLDTQRLGLERALGEGRLSLDQLTQQQRNVLDTGRLNLDRQTQQQRNQLDTRRLTTEEAELARRFGLDTNRFGLESEISRGNLALNQLTQQQLDQFRSRQLEQDAQLARERMESDMLAARYATFGRAQAPRGSWARNW